MADEPVTLATVKSHLKLEEADTEQDAYLRGLMTAASRRIEHFTGRKIVETHSDLAPRDLALVVQAMLLMIGHWYSDREGEEAMPAAVASLIRPLKRFTL
jgi:hypothetical protein